MCRNPREQGGRRPRQASDFGKIACYWFKQFLIFLHGLFDWLVDYLFSLYYNETTRKHIPNVDHAYLTDSAVTLARKIRNGELKSEELVKAVIGRIGQVNGILNAVVDERYEQALEEARAADKVIESGEWTSEQLQRTRPFHGVPFTTKDSTAVKGLHHTIGLVARRHVIAPEDADVVVLLRQAGAIPIAVTNVPELCMWYETRCNLHGQTNNPYDTNRMVGGSSGGESSILAACGSPFGIGTDIGGSIRMPAFFCGIFGHKPTTGLTPLKGLSRRTGNEQNSMVTAGPMSRHAEDLAPLLALLVQGSRPNLNLSTKVDLKRVKIHFMEDDGGDLRVSPVCSELKSCMHRALAHLQEVTLEPPTQIHLSEMKYGYRLWRHMMTKEPEKLAEELTNRQGYVIWWAETLKMILGQSEFTLPSVIRLIDQQLPQENVQWAEEKIKKLSEDLKRELGEDGVFLYPSHPYPALYHYSTFLRPYNFSYSAVINVLNFPATQVPLGLSKDGRPLGIQVIAAPYNDRLCLAVAEELQRGCGGWVPPFKTS